MKKISFNDGWTYRHLGTDEEWTEVTLPHDAMLSEPRSSDSRGGKNTGFFAGRDYEYRKTFTAPEMTPGGHLFFDFEGIYHNASIYLNGTLIAERPYGYTQIVTEAGKELNRSGENEIRVIARNADQPNSRWYSGAGIYRPVSLYVAEKGQFIRPYGIRVKTLSHNPARISVEVETSEPGEVNIDIFDPDGNRVAEATGKTRAHDEVTQVEVRRVHIASVTLDIPAAQLWSEKTPVLYRCRAAFGGDMAETSFGIRSIKWGSVSGRTVNGDRVILRGACIHSDNQMLGAASYPEAEERKVRLLKHAGYNAIRSAHNPCSSSLLDACDRLGMYVLDEYVDMWYTHKTKYDYASDMENWWRIDLRDMVEKDCSHPSVIMYSIGNEVSETAEKRGIDLTGEMTEYLHSLDRSRPVTCGINISINMMTAAGAGIYSNEKASADQQTDMVEQTGAGRRLAGSQLFNTLTGLIGQQSMKLSAATHLGDVSTRDAYEKLDIAGYNYGIRRYEKDLKKYPHRLILGTETFCCDAYDFYELAEKDPRIIGDFVWAGMDYLGETGIGAWEYPDYADPSDEKGWISAGSGRLDLTGKELGEALYTRVAMRQDRGPFMCVRPVNEEGAHTPSSWKLTNAMPSWSWRGSEGKNAVVEVYTRADRVELYLNGKRVGVVNHVRKCTAVFHVKYEDGFLQAVTYDEDGNEMGAVSLTTSGPDTVLRLEPEAETVQAGKLTWVRIRYTDAKGIWEPADHHTVHVVCSNGTLVALGSGCPYNPDGFLTDLTKTYYGEAMAIVRADGSGPVKISAKDTDGRTAVCEIPVR